MAKFHITDNGPRPCNASKRPCPVGGDHFDSTEKAEQAFEARFTDYLGGKKSQSEALQVTPEGAERFKNYRAQWSQSWDNSYRVEGLGESYADIVIAKKAAIKATRNNFSTENGAWVKETADGGAPIPAGDYVYVSTDGWAPFDQSDEPESIAFDGEVQKWADQVYCDTPPGGVGGAYFDGKPSYLLTSMTMGENHGYDGEMLIEKSAFEKLSKAGYFDTADMYETTAVQVTQDTVLYGDLGSASHAPADLFEYQKDEDKISPEAGDVLWGDKTPKGSILNNPFINVSK